MDEQKTPITAEQFKAVLDHIKTSELGIKDVCTLEKISTRSFYKYMNEVECAEKQYAQSKLIQAEIMFDGMISIADDGTNDLMTIVKGDAEYEVENKEVTNRSRLRIDTRKWALSKLLPKKYSDKLDIEHSGEIGIADVLSDARKRLNESSTV